MVIQNFPAITTLYNLVEFSSLTWINPNFLSLLRVFNLMPLLYWTDLYLGRYGWMNSHCHNINGMISAIIFLSQEYCICMQSKMSGTFLPRTGPRLVFCSTLVFWVESPTFQEINKYASTVILPDPWNIEGSDRLGHSKDSLTFVCLFVCLFVCILLM